VNWKYLPYAVLALSVGFVAIGLWDLAFSAPCAENPNVSTQAVAIGLVGIAFVAWLKR